MVFQSLFKTLIVQGGSDISALRATGRTELSLRGIYTVFCNEIRLI